MKCLIKIKTKVSVDLRFANHCCREVRVRVLALGPRLLARALGALPLVPALPGPRCRAPRGHGAVRMLGNAAGLRPAAAAPAPGVPAAPP